MGHIEIELFLEKGLVERLYFKPERGETLNIKELFPSYLNIKKWYVHEAR